MNPEETLEQIDQSGQFEKLKSYIDQHRLSKMSKKQRERLGMLLLRSSEQELKRNRPQEGYRQIKLASKASPNTLPFLFQKVISLASVGRAIERLAPKDASFVWYECARAQVFLAHLSGEPKDFLASLEYFKKAADCKMSEAKFWQEYGSALYMTSKLLNRYDFLTLSCKFLTKAVELSPGLYEGWRHLALASFMLLEKKADTSFLSLAIESFNRATDLKPKESELWREWGRLDLYLAKKKEDIELLKSAIKKLKRAFQLFPEETETLYHLGAALQLFGEWEENIDVLKKAKGAFFAAVNLSPNMEKYLIADASALFSIAKYFDSPDLYKKGIEHFKKLTRIYPKNSTGWFLVARSWFALYELSEKVEYLERCVEFCDQARCKSLFLQILFSKALYEMAAETGVKEYAKKALIELEKSIENVEVNSSTMDEIRLLYGQTLLMLGEMLSEPFYFEQAITVLQKRVDHAPEDPFSIYQLALALSQYGEMIGDFALMNGALDAYEDALQLDGEDERVWHDYGVSLFQVGKYCEMTGLKQWSLKFYEQSEEMLIAAASLGNPLSYYALAHLYGTRQDLEKTVDSLISAHKFGSLPSMDELLMEDCFTFLHNQPEFQRLIFLVSDSDSGGS